MFRAILANVCNGSWGISRTQMSYPYRLNSVDQVDLWGVQRPSVFSQAGHMITVFLGFAVTTLPWQQLTGNQ